MKKVSEKTKKRQLVAAMNKLGLSEKDKKNSRQLVAEIMKKIDSGEIDPYAPNLRHAKLFVYDIMRGEDND